LVFAAYGGKTKEIMCSECSDMCIKELLFQ
jgi:hypothetical protein